MPRRPSAGPPPVAIRLDHLDDASTVPAIAGAIASAGGRVRLLSTVRRVPEANGSSGAKVAETEMEVEGLDEDSLVAAVEGLAGIQAVTGRGRWTGSSASG